MDLYKNCKMFQFYDSETLQIIEYPDFIKLLKLKWNNIHNNTTAFRYKIENLQEKMVNEMYLLQLNPNRKSKRRTPESITNVTQAFNEKKFNFTKVSQEEIMFTFKEHKMEDAHAVVINDSPISQYHSLLCPSIYKCLPQIIDKESLKLAINLMLLTQDRELRIGFNSLCAQASVNHLHYHLFIEKRILPVENVKCKHLKGPLYCFDDSYPIPAFCFQVPPNTQKSNEIYKLLEYFIKKSIAHNVFMTFGRGMNGNSDNILRVIIWPRKSSFGTKQHVAFSVAVLELSGWFPVYDAEGFENLKADILESELRKWKIENFDNLCEEIKSMY